MGVKIASQSLSESEPVFPDQKFAVAEAYSPAGATSQSMYSYESSLLFLKIAPVFRLLENVLCHPMSPGIQARDHESM